MHRYICTYKYIHAHTYVWTHLSIFTYAYVHTYTGTCIYMCTHTYVYTSISAHTYIWTHTKMHIHMVMGFWLIENKGHLKVENGCLIIYRMGKLRNYFTTGGLAENNCSACSWDLLLWVAIFLFRCGIHSMFPLHLAALNAHSDCCRKLLSSGKWIPASDQARCVLSLSVSQMALGDWSRWLTVLGRCLPSAGWGGSVASQHETAPGSPWRQSFWDASIAA